MREHSVSHAKQRQVVREALARETSGPQPPNIVGQAVRTDRFGAALNRQRCSRDGVVLTLGYRPPPRDQAVEYHDHRENQQDVNQPAADVESERPEQPENEENYCKRPDHRRPP